MIKRKLCIFIGGYLPAKRYGGPVTSISNLVDNLGDDLDIYIVSHDHDRGDLRRLDGIQYGWNKVGKAQVIYINEKDFKVDNFVNILNEIKVDVIYLSSVFYYQMNFPAIKAAKSLGIPIILAPRGELSDNALHIGALKKKLYFKYVNFKGAFKDISFQATADEEFSNIVKRFGIKKKKVYLLPNLASVSVNKSVINKESGSLRVLTLSRILPNKNTLYSIKLIKKLQGNIVFDIYGPIEDENYWNMCLEEMKNVPGNIKISYRGALDLIESKKIYLKYDCLLLPTEFENYCQVIAESLLHDCPIIISRGTTPWDDVSDFKAGDAIKIGEDDNYINALEKVINMDTESYSELVQNVRQYVNYKIDNEGFKNKYLEMFSGVISHSDHD